MTTVAVKLTRDADVRIAVSTSADLSSPTYTSVQATSGRVAKFDLDSIATTPDTEYYYAAEIDGVLNTTTTGKFRTLGGTTLKVCFAGDAETGSTAGVFTAILNEDPHFFIHLGDLHYENLTANNTGLVEAAYDAVLGSSTQGPLYRQVPTVYVWDDHCYGNNDSHGGSANRTAACSTYRTRVPHHPLEEETGAIYHSFEVDVDGIGVVFIVTDQRADASNKTATDNSSKSMLGTAQKTWFKNLISDVANDGKLFVWICPRTFGGVADLGADHWGGFTTERTELADHIKTHALGRVLVLSADMHSLGIDDGTNHDFATGGGCPLPTFQAAPLDKAASSTYGEATYSEGQFFNNGQYGIMEIAKTGAAQLTVDWTGKRSTGTVLATHQMVINL